MSGDQIGGSIAILAMLVLVVHRLAGDALPIGRVVRMILIWIAIVAVISAIVLAVPPDR